MGPEPHFSTCARCGGTDPKPVLPISVDAFSAYVTYVTVKHHDCEVRCAHLSLTSEHESGWPALCDECGAELLAPASEVRS